ncbi:MAG: hypothetical protein FWG90_10085 [Oscillospiraceae bacterium]|nr:hypothetical protein [Oscillospiraceae bacterium]
MPDFTVFIKSEQQKIIEQAAFTADELFVFIQRCKGFKAVEIMFEFEKVGVRWSIDKVKRLSARVTGKTNKVLREVVARLG